MGVILKMSKKRLKQMQEDTMAFVGANVTMGVGGEILGRMPGGYGQQGLTNMARYSPVQGTLIGAGHTMGMLTDMMPKKKRK